MKNRRWGPGIASAGGRCRRRSPSDRRRSSRTPPVAKLPPLWFQELLRRHIRIPLDEPGDDAGPSGLVARSQPCTVVAVEVLVEEDVIAPVRVLLELRYGSKGRAPAVLITEEDAFEPVLDLLAYLVEVHPLARAGGALDSKAVSVERIEIEQAPDDQEVHREPDGSTPV